MRSRIRSRIECAARRGASVVEMTVVAPVFFLMILGMIEFGRMLMVRQALTNAAREGCRAAALVTTTSSSTADSAVRSNLQNVITVSSDTSKCRVTISPSTLSGMASGTAISTTVDVNYSDVSWIPSMFLGSAVLRGSAVMYRE